MFLAHPLFGAGLGAYMENHMRVFKEPLVIHSSAIWILAEMGLVGFAVFAGAAVRMFWEGWTHRGDQAGRLLLLILCALGFMSLVHDMLYARAFWLLLGAALAMPSALQDKSAQMPQAG
jgi:O-antigen ligase